MHYFVDGFNIIQYRGLIMNDAIKIFQSNITWEEKVFSADIVWDNILKALDGKDLPKTPRRPDVRLIAQNVSGIDFEVRNPGDHSNGKPSDVKSGTDNSAMMAMLKGNTLEDQLKNAQLLDHMFSIREKGLSPEFVEAINNGDVDNILDEAYGPAPFEGQAKRLIDLQWTSGDGVESTIQAQVNKFCAIGAREAEMETVVLVKFPLYVKGTNTVEELVESDGMCIAVQEDWQTKEISTRPIVPSVAKVFYGKYFFDIPIVEVSIEGDILNISVPSTVVGVTQQNNQLKLD